MITIRTFEVDVTPEVGDYVCGGLQGRSIATESSLLLRGLILEQDGQRAVIGAIDYCYTCGKSHQRLESALAEGAGVPVEQVTVHSNHVHDAPLLYEEVHELFAHVTPGVHNETYYAAVLSRTRQAVSAAVATGGTQVHGICFGGAAVHQFASSRRVLDGENRCHIRWSVLGRPEDMVLKEAPEGKIDPILDQILFYDEHDKPVVALCFYASHPQVSNGRLTWSADTIGFARDLFEGANPGIFTLYFDGCGGDVTAGQYTTTNRHRNRVVFGLRLYDAMQTALDRAKPVRLERIGWANDVFDMPLRVEEHDLEYFKQAIEDPNNTSKEKYLAGLKYLKLSKNLCHYPFRISRLTLDGDNVLFLPAELCVAYQIYAKQSSATRLATAAYGDCFLNYVATDEAFDQGGYEVDPKWTEVKPGCEALIKCAIDRILAVPT
jgi:hypothetical protein